MCGTGGPGGLCRLEAFLGGLRITHHFRPLLGGSRPPSAVGCWPSGSGFAWTPASGGRPTLSVRSAGARYRVPPSLPHGPAQDSPPAVHRLRWLLVLHQPRLRSRLTLGRLPLPRNPQASGVGGSRSHWRYSFRHSRFGSLHGRSRGRFSATPERSPTTWPRASLACLHSRAGDHIRGFGGRLEPRYVLGAAPLDQ